MDKVVLTIDCGTQSLRTIIFSLKGTLLAREQVHYEPYHSPHPGWAEQAPDIFWESLKKACISLKANQPELFGKIAGVGVTSLRDTMVNVDRNGNPLRPIITWLDQRKAKEVIPSNTILKIILKLLGKNEALSKLQKDGKCNWIRQNQPELWKKTFKYLQVSGYLNYKLTGLFVDSVASQIGHIPFNYKKMKWAGRLDAPSYIFPIEKEKLPKTIQPGKIIGVITPKASQETGLVEGLPVIACGSDKGCETIGMGVLNEKMASLSFGTTATVQTTAKRYYQAIRFLPPYPASIPGHYNPEIEIFRGYWMITWFKNEFAHKEVVAAKKKGISSEEELDHLLLESPPGSMGLIVQPYWGPGLKHPQAKGAMIGFGDVHKKAHVYRAVIEGLGFALLDGLHTIEKASRVRVQKLAVSGGASQSNQICQISADIFNLPLVRGKTTETSGLGAAIITSVGLGFYDSFQKAIDEMVTYDTVFKPDLNNVPLYSKLYQQVYQKIFKALEPLYENIRDITGYPE